MYESNEYGTQSVIYGGRSNRRTWLGAGASLAAVLVLLILIMAACRARDDRAGEPANGIGFGGASPTATATADPSADPDGPGESAGGQGSGGGGGGGDQGPGPGPEEEPEDVEEPASPLGIAVSIDTVTPGGQCFAAGTIAVSGGDYPVTVDYQWRRLVVAGGWAGEAVSTVQNHTFDGPGAIQVQTSNLPEDGTNVFLIVTSPKPENSGLTGYDGCADGPGGFTDGD